MKKHFLSLPTLLIVVLYSGMSLGQCTLGAPIVNINFNQGPTNPGGMLSSIVPGASTTYYYQASAYGSPPSNVVYDGEYSIVNQVPGNPAWHGGAGDHTGNGNGYMAFFNAAVVAGDFYSQVVDICPGMTYEFSIWVLNAVNSASSLGAGATTPNITLKVIDEIGNIIAQQNTGIVQAYSTPVWTQYTCTFTAPASSNSVVLVLSNGTPGGTANYGNDLAIDDITLRPCNAEMEASFTGGNCEGTSIQFYVDGGVAPYQWTGPNGFTSTLINPIVANVTVANSGMYIVSSQSECGSWMDTLIINVLPSPPVNLGNDTVICNESSFILTPQLQSIPGSIFWNTGATTSTVMVSQSGDYWIAATYESGCISRDTVNVTLVPFVVIDAIPDEALVCEHSSIQLNVTGGVNYIWTPSDYLNNNTGSNPVSTPEQTMTYYVTGMDSNGCWGNDSVVIEIAPTPVIDIEGNPDYFDCGTHEPIVLTASGADVYYWSPAENVDNPTSSSVRVFPAASGYMVVQGTTTTGCVGYDSFYVNVTGSGNVMIPNAFSPNADGINDIFSICYSCNYSLSSFRVFNRWGELVFSTNNINEGWDGYYKGLRAEVGTYFYYVEGKTVDGARKQYKGDLLLLQ